MRWSSALSLKMDSGKAVEECVQTLRRGLHGSTPDLVVAFPSGEHARAHEKVTALLRDEHPDAAFTGCAATGVIGGGHEAEATTALSLTAASLPDVSIHRFRIAPDAVPGPDVSPGVWRNVIGIDHPGGAWPFVILADPFTTRADELLRGMDYAYADCPKIGGLASGSASPGGNVLFLDDESFADGAVGLALSGNIRMDTVVSQGGRPVGPDLDVTKSERNVVFQLDGRPALEVFQEIYGETAEALPEGEQPTLFLGIRVQEIDGDADDFLIRNILGIDPGAGAIAVGSLLRDGQRVRFHLLNRSTAEDDLRALLRRHGERSGTESACGALLFSCNGRGQNLFGTPDHDTNLFHEVFRRDVPVGGLFCAGEIGPIGSSTYLHGFTSSFGILGPAGRDS